MRTFLVAAATLALAMPVAAGAPDKKTGQDYAPGQSKTDQYAPPGQVKKDGESAKQYAPGQRAHKANEKDKGSTGTSSGTGHQH